MDKKLRKNQQDDQRFRRLALEIVTEVCCFIGVLAWMTSLGCLFVGAIPEKWRNLRKQTRIRLACDGDRPIDRERYELWEFVVWGRKMYGEN